MNSSMTKYTTGRSPRTVSPGIYNEPPLKEHRMQDSISEDESEDSADKDSDETPLESSDSFLQRPIRESSFSPDFYQRYPPSTTSSPLSSFTDDCSPQKLAKARRPLHKLDANVKPCKCTFGFWRISLLGVVVCAALAVNCRIMNITDTDKTHLAKGQLTVLQESIKTVQAQFPSQNENIWNDISSVIYDVVLYPEKPGIIILFGNSVDTVRCLAHLLGDVSSRILGTDKHLSLNPRDFKNDVGEVIHELKYKIIQQKSVVVENLLGVNAEALKAFHNFCDRENPLVGEVVYILTMAVKDYNISQPELHNVEQEITNNFRNEIDKDMLDPIITRITDGAIVRIQPEINANDCSSLSR